jgi:hypothetical protein
MTEDVAGDGDPVTLERCPDRNASPCDLSAMAEEQARVGAFPLHHLVPGGGARGALELPQSQVGFVRGFSLGRVRRLVQRRHGRGRSRSLESRSEPFRGRWWGDEKGIGEDQQELRARSGGHGSGALIRMEGDGGTSGRGAGEQKTALPRGVSLFDGV